MIEAQRQEPKALQPQYRVLIADDEVAVREAMRALLEHDARFRVVASVGSADEAAAVAEELRPELAVVDVRMPGGGHRAVTAIRERSPDTVVVVCTSYDDSHTRESLTAAGAAAFVVKGSHDLLGAVQAVLPVTD